MTSYLVLAHQHFIQVSNLTKKSACNHLITTEHIRETITLNTDMEINTTETCMYSMEDDPLASQKSKRQPFFACYLLCSLSSRHKGCTYIGFTVNPRRRIRQHNGEIKSGAHQTKRKRPWEMILCIYGFPSQVSALQFEWAWQHPKESLAVKEAVKGLKQKQLGGIAGKIRLAYIMLTLSEWKSLNLAVNFLSTKYVGHTKGCPTLPSYMKVQICPVDELPCYTDNWLSDGEDDLEEKHCFGTSDVSDPEEEVEGEKDLAYQKKSTEIEKQQEQECDQQPAKKSRRRGRPLKQLKSSLSADELGSKITVPSPRKLSSSTLQADAKTKGSNRLNGFFSDHDCLLKISDSENSEDSHSASGSSSMPNSSLPVNLRQETSNAVENNWSINYQTDCCLAKGSEAEMSKDISDDFSIKSKLIAASDPVEYKLSNDLKIDYIVSEDSEVDQIINNIDDFRIKRITTTSSNMIEFPSLQEYSPVCYISPLKTSEEALLSFTSPCKSTPTEKLINVNYSFLSPVACQGQVITILSTPRPISRGVIDLTDSPAT